MKRSSAALSRWLAAAFLACVGVLPACSDDGDAASTSTSTSSTATSRATTTSSTELSDDADAEAVRKAYEAANRAYIDAAALPDPNHLGIAATHTGPMLQQARDVLAALQRDQRVIRYPSDSKYRVVVEDVEVDGDIARLEFCAIDDGERVDTRTGEVISSGVLTARGDAAMRLEDGTWRLAEQSFTSREEGVATCD